MVALGMMGDTSGPKQPYTGKYNLEQRLAAGKDGVAATGQLGLADFVVTGGAFNEKSIRFANDVTLDSGRDALALRNVVLSMESTKALELKLAGNILDYSTKRRFDNVAGTIGYDWAKLWEIVRQHAVQNTVLTTMQTVEIRDHKLEFTGPSGKSLTLQIKGKPAHDLDAAVFAWAVADPKHEPGTLRFLDDVLRRLAAVRSHALPAALPGV